MYEDPARTVKIATDEEDIGLIGFDAGDRRRSIAIVNRDNKNFTLESSNVFRIDGMLSDSLSCCQVEAVQYEMILTKRMAYKSL